MKLIRLTIIHLHPTPRYLPERSTTIQMGEVHVDMTLVEDGKLPELKGAQLIAKASIQITPEVIDGHIIVPELPRKKCEDATEFAADVYSVTCRSARSIVTVNPAVAFCPETDDDREILRGVKGIKFDDIRSHPKWIDPFPITTELLMSLRDRRIGLMLMAEAYSHTRMSGRYRELVRFFEAAFRLPFTELPKKLSQTLRPSMGYTRQEIKGWTKWRDLFAHADGKKTPEVAFEADVQHFVGRMEQAALDILFNKKEWGKGSSERRAIWSPTAISNASDGSGLVVLESKVNTEFLLLDRFGVYPLIFRVKHTNLPEEWLVSPAEQPDNSKFAGFQVVKSID